MPDPIYNPNNIVSHKLYMTNTINHAKEYIGKKSYSLNIERASSFTLDLYNVNEDWDEGSGYDFIYNDTGSRRIMRVFTDARGRIQYP